MKNAPIKHVIFDWSGTLYNDHGPSYLATKKIFAHFGLKPISKAEYQKNFELPADRFYKRYGMNESLAVLNDIYFKIYEEYYNRGHLFKGVKELLKLLKKNGVTVSIFSTVRQDLLEDLCRKEKVTKYFTKIHGSVCDKRKEITGHLRSVKSQAKHTLFVGDMDHDVHAANEKGLHSGCVRSGYHDVTRLIQAKPAFVWDEPNDMLPFFKSLLKKQKIKKAAQERAVPTVGALIFNPQKKILLVHTHKWDYTYGIPGGKIEYGESIAQATKREIKEETGLTVSLQSWEMVQDCIFSKEFYLPKAHFILFNCLATTKQTRVTLNDEALSYIWIDPKLALNLRLNEPTRALIEKYLQTKLKTTTE